MQDAIRLFHCRFCAHKMRLGARRCGKCGQPSPIFNHAETLAIGGLLILAAGLWIWL